MDKNKNEIIQERNPLVPKEKQLILWQAEEFVGQEKNTRWYSTIFFILISILIFSFFTDNFLLAILAILIAIVGYLVKKQAPGNHQFGILPEGIMAQDHLYEYENIESFWIFYSPGGKKALSIKSKRKIMPYVQIPLGNANPMSVRSELLKFIPEKKQEESLFDLIEKLF